ncbi:Chaperone protein HtpG [Olavius algarvensis spirochete endosymbiont]|uniref:molecular chaperone HtpG n=1 Tax=Olavius algarvensis spirochete endosymbiont TaxID=260710 RepID=UPI00052D4A5E|nr:molecular chaperone HtpG [Olavius algarvensis spirochete endosymbiont]KGM43239.1 molecular chaperone Hsp90 [Alkalispirochaeta odontotermitis]VDB00039.1 Chaperone protein HtpG [Olavius algarvensis spirochete endosymbiont]
MKKFKTEVSQLLNLLIHSLYSHNEIFLRELISNSSDALDRLKYLTLTDDALKGLDFKPRIDIRIGEKEEILVIEDNGIGMNGSDLADSLGTIARSGTRNFMEELTGDAKKDSNLIGQFGVGFYSCFMVASSVEVVSRKTGDDKAWKWTSNGESGFTIEETERETQGTTVTLKLNEAGKEYDSQWKVKSIIKKYSDHIAFPIHLHWTEKVDKKEEKKDERVNSASALWKRPKSELKTEDYNEFYKTFSHDSDDFLLRVHVQAEGTLEYTTLFFVPQKAPIDMFQADYKPGVKLYVKRVFITDDNKELLPVYLRFVRGVIDSEDLPLNVSRETLQQNKIMVNIREASVKKLLAEFKKLSENEKKYVEFIEQYNRPLKEGLYSDWAHKDDLLELVRYKSTAIEGWTSLEAYRNRMPENQKTIYYLIGENEETLRKSPLLAAYKEKGFEVLFMSDEIDEIITPMIGPYKKLEMKAINRSGALDDLKTDDDKKREKTAEPVLKKIKKVLGESVKDVVGSTRLSDAPSCLVSSEGDPSAQLRQMLQAMGQKDIPEATFILEINPDHPVVKGLADSDDKSLVDDVARLLYEQALLVEGATLKDPTGFATRLNRITARAF